MGTKKIQKQLNKPLTTVKAIIKKFQTSGTVANFPGRGRKYMLSPRTVRKMAREAKKNPRTTVQELQTLVASWGHKVLLRATNISKRLEFAKRAMVR